MKDIAKACGVSTATVSYVLNDVPNQSISAATRKRILHMANMVGYVSSASARALATGKNNTFGVYMPHCTNAAHKHRLLQALAEEAEKAGYALVMLTGKCLTRQVNHVDAVFAVDISQEDFSALGENSFVPLLYLDGQAEDILFYCISFDAAALCPKSDRKVALVCDEPHSRDYAAYLRSVFADIVPDSSKVPADCCAVAPQELALNYSAYAQLAVSTAIAAIRRENQPLEHHLRVT